jgi:hypothetical protein
VENCANLPRTLARAGTAGSGAGRSLASTERTARPAQLRACSACAGDYEDPDRTAWTDDASEDEDDERPAPAEEFPVPCK